MKSIQKRTTKTCIRTNQGGSYTFSPLDKTSYVCQNPSVRVLNSCWGHVIELSKTLLSLDYYIVILV